MIATGIRSNDLYVLQPKLGMALYSNRFRTVSMQTWHQRLGHPQLQVVKYLVEHGIHHQMSCPGTSEQNGLAEHKHINITKLCLTMLFHGEVPKRLGCSFQYCCLVN